MSKLEYKTNSLLGDPSRIEVRRGRHHLGNIRKQPNGPYQYYRGSNNQLNPGPTAKTLPELKEKIEALEPS